MRVLNVIMMYKTLLKFTTDSKPVWLVHAYSASDNSPYFVPRTYSDVSSIEYAVWTDSAGKIQRTRRERYDIFRDYQKLLPSDFQGEAFVICPYKNPHSDFYKKNFKKSVTASGFEYNTMIPIDLTLNDFATTIDACMAISGSV